MEKNNESKTNKTIIIICVILSILSIVLISTFIVAFARINSKINKISETIIEKVEEQIENNDQLNINDEFIDLERKIFNLSFEAYIGNQNIDSIEFLLDNVINSNKREEDHIIVVTYKNKSTSNIDEITDIKNSLEDNKEYEVLLDYDTKGFVNKVIIKHIIN